MVLSYIAYRKGASSMQYLKHCFKHIYAPGWQPMVEWCRLNEPAEVRGWHEMRLGDWAILR